MRIGTSVGRLQCHDCEAFFIQKPSIFHTATATPHQLFSTTKLLALQKRILAAATDIVVKRLVFNVGNGIRTQQQPKDVATPPGATIQCQKRHTYTATTKTCRNSSRGNNFWEHLYTLARHIAQMRLYVPLL